TGPGIPVDLRESIFDEFTRVEEGSALKGHGLGLAIARRVARLLGGDLTVGDGPGGGALFTLWLPVVPISPAASGAPATVRDPAGQTA
ncbi:MAG TPA: sensor histidine kinase, partial [Gemmatimonadaceae bacterium]|nr:sensor histidine kinase [Gemmatimonadaceae bacterium]